MSPARRAYAKKDSPVILTESFSTVTDESIRRRQEQVIRAWVNALLSTVPVTERKDITNERNYIDR